MRAVNLIPVDRRVGAGVGLGRSQGGAYAVIGIVILLALMVFLYGKASHQVTSDKSQTAKVTTEAEQAKSDAGALARFNGLISESEARTTAAETLIDTRFDWAHTLARTRSRAAPADLALRLTGTVVWRRRKRQKKLLLRLSSSSSSSSSAPAPARPRAIHGDLGNARRQPPQRDPRRLRHQPDRCRGNAPAHEADRRRQGSHADELGELHEQRQRRVQHLPEPERDLQRQRSRSNRCRQARPPATTDVSNPATPAGSSATSTGGAK